MLPVSADAGAVLGFDAFVPVPDQVVVEVVDEFVDALVLVVLVVVELLFEAAEEALERGPDRFEQPLVPSGPVELFEVVVERAACDAHTLQQVAVAQAEHGRQVHHDTGLLTVGQVVRVAPGSFPTSSLL